MSITSTVRTQTEDEAKVDFYYTLWRDENPNEHGNISVMAKITDLDAWKNLTDVTTTTKTKVPASERDKNLTWIVTATIPADDFPKIANLPFVKSLRFPRSLETM